MSINKVYCWLCHRNRNNKDNSIQIYEERINGSRGNRLCGVNELFQKIEERNGSGWK